MTLRALLAPALLGLLTATTAAEPTLPNDQGPVASGPRPAGALSGKIVYVHGGHGYTADNKKWGGWSTQRPLLLGMVEDLGNKDQMDFFVDHLFRSGATIVPLRPVGHQLNEAVLDNADPGVTFTGDWRVGIGGVHFGPRNAEPYRYAAAAPSETATATYSPNLPEAGVYPVYAWTTAGPSRAPDQRYRVRHAGGETVVTVDHRRVGSGLVYLGSYFFNAGRAGSVVISNASDSPGSTVVADMIRFGNGRGDIDRGGGISGLAREDEAGLYWVMWHVERCQGIGTESYRATDVDRTATISLSPRYAAFMNQERDGELSDRVFVSFHSNAGAGKARGVLGLYNGNNYYRSKTPNHKLLAETLAREVNKDLVSISSRFEHAWHDQNDFLTLDRSDIEFGEINNKYLQNEFDATIIETGYHDNRLDAEMLRDPAVRDAIARATCQGLIKYFHEVDGGMTRVGAAPPRVVRPYTVSKNAGAVTLHWDPPTASDAGGDRATGYVVYCSADGRAFDAGRAIAGGSSTRFTVSGLDADRVHYFRIAAANRAGQSRPSKTLACAASPAAKRVLIVDGFDRVDRKNNPRELHRSGGDVERVRMANSNPQNAAVATARALSVAAPGLGVATACADAVGSGRVDLAGFDAVLWLLAEETSPDGAINESEQAAIEAYLAQGGSLLVSGSELAWDLDSLRHGRRFCREVLRVKFAEDNAQASKATGDPYSALAGLEIEISDRAGYPIDSPDVFEPISGAMPALVYNRPGGGAAGVQFANDNQKVIALALPIGSIANDDTAEALLARVMAFFELIDLPQAP